ncbi:MAG: SRPBCC family protein [Holophagaceae bacterium]|nr:SRPBCC family protein [Holophagaceae bacterium]
MVVNIHAREYPVSAERLGALLDGLGSPGDQLWPGHRWPALRFDGPLRTGAKGGHGPIRYTVEAYEPGRSLRCRFTGPAGFIGWHGFDIEPVGADRSILRHTVRAELRQGMRLQWPLAIRWLHDACVEDALDCAARAFGEALPDRPFTPAVRLLRRLKRRSR